VFHDSKIIQNRRLGKGVFCDFDSSNGYLSVMKLRQLLYILICGVSVMSCIPTPNADPENSQQFTKQSINEHPNWGRVYRFNPKDSVHVEIPLDISFEFVNCSNVSAIKVLNSPTNSNIKDKNGLFIDGISASFVSGTSESNRVVDISNSSTLIKSNIKINNFSMGSLSSITPSATPIELIYIDHNEDTVVNIENMEFVNADQPNADAVVTVGSVTSLTAIKANTGKIIVNNVKLDEKMYWNNTTFSDVKTLFLDATGTSHFSIQNISIVRDAYNTLELDHS
jgi:hypothetical protein